MAEIEKSYMQNVNALNNTNIPNNLNTLKGMIGKINNQIKTWNNNFKLSTATYINNINDENIMNFINIYKKAKETYNIFNNNLTLIHGHINNKNSVNNNILEGLYSNSENSLKIFQKRIEAQKALFITNLNIYINKTYNQTLKNYTESINNTVSQLNELRVKFDELISSNELNLTNIKNTYKSITTNKSQSNKPLRNSFNKLISSLTNFATINTQNTNRAFETYKTLYQDTSNILKKNKTNMSSKIQERIKNLNKNINTKTKDLNTLITSINAKISGLKNIINKNTNNVFKFSNKQKASLVEIIDELNTSIKDSNATFIAENDKLKVIKTSLENLIGDAAGATATGNARGSLNFTLGQNAEIMNTTTKIPSVNAAGGILSKHKKPINLNLNSETIGEGNSLILKAANNQAAAQLKANANTNANTNTNANDAQTKVLQTKPKKKMKELTNTNINKSFIYKNKNGTNIGFTYKGKTNKKKIIIKRNGKNQQQQLSTNTNSGLLNKNIFPKK